jgi:hypothetical protein
MGDGLMGHTWDCSEYGQTIYSTDLDFIVLNTALKTSLHKSPVPLTIPNICVASTILSPSSYRSQARSLVDISSLSWNVTRFGGPWDWVGIPENIKTGFIASLSNVCRSFSIRWVIESGWPPVPWTIGSLDAGLVSRSFIYCLASIPSRVPLNADNGAVWERWRSLTQSERSVRVLRYGVVPVNSRSKPRIPILCSLLSVVLYLQRRSVKGDEVECIDE